jgi:hypothetical protein
METNKGLQSKSVVISSSKVGVVSPDAEGDGRDARKERRLHIAVRVKVFLNDNSPDSQACCTYEISTTGARLVAAQGIKEVGQVVSLQRHNRRAKFKVIWLGKPDTPHSGQVGVEALEANNVIWENEIKIRLARSEEY